MCFHALEFVYEGSYVTDIYRDQKYIYEMNQGRSETTKKL